MDFRGMPIHSLINVFVTSDVHSCADHGGLRTVVRRPPGRPLSTSSSMPCDAIELRDSPLALQ